MDSSKPILKNSRKAEKFRATECLNCGQPLELTDRYCSYCSQLNTTKHLAIKDFFGEFIGSIITYDSRFRYTLKDLLFKPGTITRNYVSGRRLQYANPFRFFLSVSIIYFIVQGLIGTFTQEPEPFEITDKEGKNLQVVPVGNNNFKLITADLAQDSINADSVVRQTTNQLDSIFKQNNIPVTTSVDSTDLNFNPFNFRKDTVQTYTPISEAALDTMSWAERNIKKIMLYRNFYRTTEISNAVVALDSLGHKNSGYNRWIYDKNDAMERIENKPGDFVQYLLEKTPFFVFFFTPVFAFFFWLIYSKKRYTYMEHMILIFNIFSFVFLAMLISLIPDSIIGYDVFSGLVFGLIGPFYFYKSLRNFYKENRILTIIKFLFLNWVFWTFATIAAVLFFAVTAAFY